MDVAASAADEWGKTPPCGGWVPKNCGYLPAEFRDVLCRPDDHPLYWDKVVEFADRAKQHYLRSYRAVIHKRFVQKLRDDLNTSTSFGHRLIRRADNRATAPTMSERAVGSDPDGLASLVAAQRSTWQNIWCSEVAEGGQFAWRSAEITRQVQGSIDGLTQNTDLSRDDKKQLLGGTVTLKDFRAVCRCYPERKALGPDGWRAWELSVLPDTLLRAVVSLINKRVVSGWWDHSLEAVWMSVIPKPSGGHRCVGKTPMVYRIWAASRRDDIKKWEINNMAPWDSSGPSAQRLRPPATVR